MIPCSVFLCLVSFSLCPTVSFMLSQIFLHIFPVNQWLEQLDSSLFVCLFLMVGSIYKIGFPGGANGKEPICQCRRHKRHRFNPWVRKIPWRRKWQPTPVHCLEIPWTEEPGRLQSMESQRVRHDWSTTLSTFHMTKSWPMSYEWKFWKKTPREI